MKITLFGGSFNPPHIGHQIVINQALELIKNLDEIWLLPDHQHSFSKNREFAAPVHRLAMTKMLEQNRVQTQTCNLDRKMSGNTIQHITFLQKKYPGHQFSFLMGSDNLKSFSRWPRYRELLRLMPFYIYPRANIPFKPLYENMYPLTHPLQVITNISSTLVRKRIKKQLPVNHLIPPPVLKYIKKYDLY